MQTLKYKGYTISQAENNHIMITKDNQMVFHSSCTKPKNETELKEEIDRFIKLSELIKEVK